MILTRVLNGPRVLGGAAGNRNPGTVCEIPESADDLRGGLDRCAIEPGRPGMVGIWSSGTVAAVCRLKKAKKNRA